MRLLFFQIKIILILILISTPLLNVSAHGSGFSYEEVVDGFLVDIGYSLELPMAGKMVRFDFETYPETPTDESGSVFSDVWVSIKLDNELYFSGNINRPVFGPTAINLVLSESGVYEVSARFQKDGATVVANKFEYEVLPATDTTSPSNYYGYLGIALAGLLVGGFVSQTIGFFFSKKMNKK